VIGAPEVLIIVGVVVALLAAFYWRAYRKARRIVRLRAGELAIATGLDARDIEREIVARRITPGDWAVEHRLDRVTFRPNAQLAHTVRFRKVSTLYPRLVAEAYGDDIAQAAADSDEQVAATVAQWERDQGHEPRDWVAIGGEERADHPDVTEAGH